METEDFNLRKTIYGVSSHKFRTDSWSYTTHATTATTQDAMRGIYLKALYYLKDHKPLAPPRPSALELARVKRWEVATKVPFVRTSCRIGSDIDLSRPLVRKFVIVPEYAQVWNENLTDKPNGTETPHFQRMTSYLNITMQVRRYLEERRILDLSSGNVVGLNNQTTPPILAVPISLWNGTAGSMGLVVLKRRDTTTWFSAQCTIDARWAKARSIIKSVDGNNMLIHEFVEERVRTVVTTELDIPGSDQLTSASFVPPSDGSLRRILIHLSWFKMLAPIIPPEVIPRGPLSTQTASRTTLESLLELILLPEHGGSSDGIGESTEHFGEKKVEHLLSTYFADGLSRCGSTYNLNASRFLGKGKFGDWGVEDEELARTMVRIGDPEEGFPRPAQFTPEMSARFVMKAYFTGYVMATVGWVDYLCVVVLLIHILIAICHTIWVIVFNQSSEAWDTIPELVALAQKSPPPPESVLRNTCAGIRTLRNRYCKDNTSSTASSATVRPINRHRRLEGGVNSSSQCLLEQALPESLSRTRSLRCTCMALVSYLPTC